MPYEAAAYDDLASKANRAAAAVERNADEAEDAFQGRVEAARASVLGLTRNAGEAMEGFRDRIEEALGLRSGQRALAGGKCGDSASRPADRGREAVQGFYEQGASALHGVRIAPAMRRARCAILQPHDRLCPGAAPAVGRPGDHRRRGHRHAAAVLALRAPDGRVIAGEPRRVARQVVGEAGQSVARVAESVLDTAQEATRREGFVDTEGRDLAAVARDKVADVAGRARHVVEETAAAGREAVRRELAGRATVTMRASLPTACRRIRTRRPGGRGGERIART